MASALAHGGTSASLLAPDSANIYRQDIDSGVMIIMKVLVLKAVSGLTDRYEEGKIAHLLPIQQSVNIFRRREGCFSRRLLKLIISVDLSWRLTAGSSSSTCPCIGTSKPTSQ